jgi:hypothetical protein
VRRGERGRGEPGFHNRWYEEAILHAIDVEAEGERFRIVSPPYFCATKLDVFADRGGGDVYHHDLEDVIAIVDGRSELLAELEGPSAPRPRVTQAGQQRRADLAGADDGTSRRAQAPRRMKVQWWPGATLALLSMPRGDASPELIAKASARGTP